jgi:hypothetical protein
MLVEEQKYHPPCSGRLSPARSRGKGGEFKTDAGAYVCASISILILPPFFFTCHRLVHF